MQDKFRIDVDSFGSNCPDNWEEIADYLNNVLEEIWDQTDEHDDFNEVVERIWDKYCSDMLPDAPEAIY